MPKHRHDKIYRIIGGVSCERIDEHGSFKCVSRAAIRKARTALASIAQGQKQ